MIWTQKEYRCSEIASTRFQIILKLLTNTFVIEPLDWVSRVNTRGEIVTIQKILSEIFFEINIPWSNAFWPGLTPFGPPMWQAEADTELTLFALPTTAVGQKALAMAKRRYSTVVNTDEEKTQRHSGPNYTIFSKWTDQKVSSNNWDWFIKT